MNPTFDVAFSVAASCARTARIFPRAVIAGLLVCAGMSLGCDKSPSGPTPSGPTPSAPTPPAALTVTSVSPTTGSTVGLAEIRIAGTGFVAGATVTLGGVAARVRSVSSTLINAETPAHTPGAVDAVVANPGGESRTLTGGYTFVVDVFALTASPSVVTSGGPLTVSWVAPAGRGCIGGGDWVAIYRVGDPDTTGAANGHSDLWYTHLCGTTSGTSTLNAPSDPGEYEFRYMVGNTAVGRSNPVTVSASASPVSVGSEHN
jgi:uncharacterized protein (TIGR03437 family)